MLRSSAQRSDVRLYLRDTNSTKLSKAECVRARKGLALPRLSHSGEIALAGSRRLRSTLTAAPVLFAPAVFPLAKSKLFRRPYYTFTIFLVSKLAD
jgi:hypothetical protein